MNRAHDETSEALLAAAHRLLASDGPSALTVRRIATQAGMSTMNVYSRFGGKDGVIDELYLHGYRELFSAIDAVPETDDTVEDLLRVALAYRNFAIAQPMYYEIMFRKGEPSAEASEVALGSLGTIAGRITRGAERGSIALPDALGPEGVTAWLWATCHGLVSLELDGVAEQAVTWSEIFEAAMRMTVAGLRPSSIATEA